MSEEFKKDFGFFTQTQGPSNNAVTSITAGAGLTATPNPITGTGTIGETQTSTITIPEQDALTLGVVGIFRWPVIDATFSKYTTYSNNNRNFFSPSMTQTDTGNSGQLGYGGLAWGDAISITSEFETNCAGGSALQMIATFNGTLQGFTGSFTGGANFTCDGTTQTKTYTATTQRVGVDGGTNLPPRNPSSDYWRVIYFNPAGATGTITMKSFTSTITSFSD